jgi:ABC-type transport system involved in cytochrome bd biosynthesis fused ATPase/permease subunit
VFFCGGRRPALPALTSDWPPPPRAGSSAYPATLFTDAPPEVLWDAVAGLSDAAPAASPALQPAPAPLLELRGVALQTPGEGRLIATGLTLVLAAGEHLAITGPNGAGKSTLLRALCGLHPLLRGAAAVAGRPAAAAAAAAGGAALVAFLPQRPLAAPGAALWHQLAYPSADRPPDAELLPLLQAVGLLGLLRRAGGSLDAPPAQGCWAAALSPGELQRLGIARVLRRRPALALLDEATSAVGAADAEALHALLAAQGVTCVSVRQGGAGAGDRWHLQLGGAQGAPCGWRLRGGQPAAAPGGGCLG